MGSLVLIFRGFMRDVYFKSKVKITGLDIFKKS